MRNHPACVFGLLVLGACSDVSNIEAGRLLLTAGREASPWEVSPRARTVHPYSIAPDGTLEQTSPVEAPITQLFATQPGAHAYGFFARDEEATRVLGARSLYVDSATLAESSLPLFFSRTRAFARPTGSFVEPPGPRPVHAMLQGRYWVTLTRSSSGNLLLQGYDLLTWSVDADAIELRCPVRGCVPQAAAGTGWKLLVLGSSWAMWVDLEDGTSGDVTLPPGLDSFAEIAGARTVQTPNDVAYLVGPTKSDEASSAVLLLDADGSLSVVRTVASRRAAAAAWVDGLGLLVAGGNDTAPPAELLDPADRKFQSRGGDTTYRGYSPQVAVQGLSAVVLGGVDAEGAPSKALALDLTCRDCLASSLELFAGAAGGVASFDPEGRILVAGSDDSGAQAAFLVDVAAGITESIPAPRPRSDASYAVLPTGHLGIVGGLSPDGGLAQGIELILP